MTKVQSPVEAIKNIKSGDTLCISGSGGGLLEPDFIL